MSALHVGGVVQLFPAADDIYTFKAQPGEDRESFKTLVNLSARTNSWGVSDYPYPHVPPHNFRWEERKVVNFTQKYRVISV